MAILSDDLRTRSLTPELMDDPAIDPRRHAQALRGLARINYLSRSAKRLWSTLRPLARASARPLRVLDIATGSGDVLVVLLALAHRDGIEIEVDGCDISDTALRNAAERAATSRVRIGVHQLDVTRQPLPRGYDAVVSSLFMHHLSDEHARRLLERMADAALFTVVVNDLRRCRAGLLLAWIGSRLLSRSDVVRTDAVRSVRAAFTPAELLTLASQAGLAGASISRITPYRMRLVWRRP